LEKIKKIFFITPSFNRTGSEIVLFNLLKDLGNAYKAKVLSVENGPLLRDLSPAIEQDHLIKQGGSGLIHRIKRKIALDYILPVKLYFNRDRVWYINTVVIPRFLKYAKKYKTKVIVHTHELEHMWNVLESEAKADLISVPALVIANSKFSADVFRKNGYKGPIEISHPSIDTEKYSFDHDAYASVRKKMSISESTCVWLMCGTIDENKNPELFIEIAAKYQSIDPSARFIWLGDNKNDPEYKEKCLQKSKHLDNLIWIHEGGSAYLNYMQCCDRLLLTSKFESFSLVTLEALALGKPVIANDCLGVSEIINSDEIGIIVKKKNDADAFCEVMKDTMNGRLQFDSAKAVQRSKAFDHKAAVKNWKDILASYI
jgi:L-malate glycosyltransferase